MLSLTELFQIILFSSVSPLGYQSFHILFGVISVCLYHTENMTQERDRERENKKRRKERQW